LVGGFCDSRRRPASGRGQRRLWRGDARHPARRRSLLSQQGVRLAAPPGKGRPALWRTFPSRLGSPVLALRLSQ
jgi:hypothetical protein